MTPRQRRILRKAIKLARAGQTQYAVDRHINEWTAPARVLAVMPIRLSQVDTPVVHFYARPRFHQ